MKILLKRLLKILSLIIVVIGFLFLDQRVGLFYASLIIGCFSAGFYFILWLAHFLITREKSHDNWMLYAACIFFVAFFTFHIIMSIQLAPIKKEFASITIKVDPKEILDESVGSGVVLDYGGKLDAVIAKRDAFLKKHGYFGIGTWWVTSGDADTNRIVYLKDPAKLF